MGTNNIFLFKIFILLCLICVVFGEHQKSHNKREVHRIILKERPTRSHKAHGHHGHSHSRKKGHKNKGKRESDESNSSSFEDSASSSIENNSFEDPFRGHKTHGKKTIKKHTFARHRFPSNLDIEESRHHPFREEITPFYNSDWVPLSGHSSDHLHSPSDQHHTLALDPHREKDTRHPRKTKKRSQKSNKGGAKHFGGPLTASYTPVTFESSTLYPPIDVLQSFTALNQKFLQNNPSVMSTFEQTTLKDLGKLKNHKPTYDVTEVQNSAPGEFILVPEKPDFSSLEYVGKFDDKDLGNQLSKNVKVRKTKY